MNKLLLLFLAGFLLACSSVPKKPSTPSSKESDLNGAYTTLYELVSKQKDLDKISIIKTISPELKPLLKDISEASEKIAKKLKAWSSKDSELQLNLKPMPFFEAQVRKEIEFDTTKKIIGSSSDTLEKLLLFKQNEALNYQSYLCRWLAQNETHAARQEELKDFERKSIKLNRRASDLLSLNK